MFLEIAEMFKLLVLSSLTMKVSYWVILLI